MREGEGEGERGRGIVGGRERGRERRATDLTNAKGLQQPLQSNHFV